MFDNSDLNSSIKLRTPLRFVISLLFFVFLSVPSQSFKCKDFPFTALHQERENFSVLRRKQFKGSLSGATTKKEKPFSA